MGKQSARKAKTRDNGHLYWARKQTKLLNRMASHTMGHPAPAQRWVPTEEEKQRTCEYNERKLEELSKTNS
jgi:hypothetical protein